MAVLKLMTDDPYLNLATEEVLFRNHVENDDLFIVWRSLPAFIVGRNQNPFLEIKPEFRDKRYPVIRRISGGGTVFSDLGTLNFSYITRGFEDKVNNYLYFLEPVIEALKKFDIPVEFLPKSHLVINSVKISGNAQAFQGDRLLHHGTLLFDTDLSVIKEALIEYNPESSGHHVLSNKQEVANLKDYVLNRVSLDAIQDEIINTMTKRRNVANTEYVISRELQEDIFRLAKEKYHSWKWNYGKTPTFEAEIKVIHTDVLLRIEQGLVANTSPFRENLIGLKYDSKEFQEEIKKGTTLR